MSDSDDRLELFFSQSLDGFFFMMLDEPVTWDRTVDKDRVLDYVFGHQRVTKVNDAMLKQYGATCEQFLGLTPRDFYRHDLEYGRRVWREFFDRGRLHVETDERRLDGTRIWIEGDYICLYDAAGRISGHFGIQRDVTDRKQAEEALRRYNRRLQVLHDTQRAILASQSARGIAEATMRHIGELVPCWRASVAVFDGTTEEATILALHAKGPTRLVPGTVVPVAVFGVLEELRQGVVSVVEDLTSSTVPPLLQPLVAEGLRSCISVPMRADRELIGVLGVGSTELRAFTPEHVEIAQELANTLAVAIRQARLRERVEQHAAELEERVAARTAELAQSESRLRAIANALPDPVFVIDEDGRYVEILAGEAHLPYRAAEELRGRRLHELLPFSIAEEFVRVVHKTLETGMTHLIEYPHTSAGRFSPALASSAMPIGERWFEGRSALLQVEIGGKRCIVFIARDITDRKRAEQLETQNVYLQEELKIERNFGDIVGSAAAMQHVFRNIERVAGTDSTVLLLGETGTGKELIARAIHTLSTRRHMVLVKVNCGVLPGGLAESELFGHEKGAFTGAIQQKKGRFELAHNGTIFLDEVGELTPDVQVKLLRVLQEQELERVGGTQTIRVNVRVIAATNRDLLKEVQRGSFRADLFYRLNVFPIQVPPLRERREDIPQLAHHFVQEFSRRIGRDIQGLGERALERLMMYDWPGNVRELANVLERAVILCQGRVLEAEHIGSLAQAGPVAQTVLPLGEMERQHILRALEQTGGVLAGPRGAARLLGINRSTLWSRMRKHGIDPPKP